MKVVYWDRHGDEYRRVSGQLAPFDISVEKYVSATPPTAGDVFFVHETDWFSNLSPFVRSRTILSLTQRIDGKWRQYGVRHAIFKHNNHATEWGEGGFCVPPLCGAQVSDGGSDIVSLINDWKVRDATSFQFAAQIPGLKMYGSGPGQLGWAQDFEVLRKSRFLVHVKHLGYLCNAVVKAIVMGVPVLTDPETLNYGYDDLLIPGQTCVVSPDIEILKLAARMQDDEYRVLRDNCLALRSRLTAPDPLVRDLVTFMHELIRN